jgi:hypothetical protein
MFCRIIDLEIVRSDLLDHDNQGIGRTAAPFEAALFPDRRILSLLSPSSMTLLFLYSRSMVLANLPVPENRCIESHFWAFLACAYLAGREAYSELNRHVKICQGCPKNRY